MLNEYRTDFDTVLVIVFCEYCCKHAFSILFVLIEGTDFYAYGNKIVLMCERCYLIIIG